MFLRAGLRLAGHEEISFDRLRVGLRRLELTGLALGGRSHPEQLVGRLTIEYRPGDLLRGRIEAVSVEGLTLRGRVDQDGLRLEGLDLAAAGPGGRPGCRRCRLAGAGLDPRPPARADHPGRRGHGTRSRRSSTRSRIAPHSCSTRRTRSWPRRPDGCSADVHVEGAMPLDMRSLADAITASGRAQLRAEALTLPGVARGIDGAGELAFSWRHGRLDGALSNLDAQLELLAPEWAIVAQLLPAPWRIELAQPASVSASLADDGFQLQGSGRITLATAGPQLDSDVQRDRRPGPARADARAGRARRRRSTCATCASPACGSIAARSRVQGSGAPEAWDGSLALELAGAGAPWPGLAARGRHRTGRSGRAPGRWPPQPEPARSGHAAARRAELGRRCPGQRAGGARAAGLGAAAQRRAGGRSNAMAAARAREPAGIRGDRVGRQDAASPHRGGRRAGPRAGRRRAGPA